MPSTLDETVGAFLIATFITVYLGGITSLQAAIYYLSDARLSDSWAIKTLVYSLFVADNVHSAFCCVTMYRWLVTFYGDPSILAEVPWTFTVDPAMVAIVTFACQMFYAWRVYIVGGRQRILPIAIVILSVLQMAFGVAGTFAIFTLCDNLFANFHRFTYGVTIWLVGAAAADVLITFSLIYYLRKATGDEEKKFQRSATVVDKIIHLTIETNGLTMSVAIIDAVLFVWKPDLGYHVIANFALIKLYANGVMVSLNSRQRLSTMHRSFVASATGLKTCSADHGIPMVSHIEFAQRSPSEQTETKSEEPVSAANWSRPDIDAPTELVYGLEVIATPPVHVPEHAMAVPSTWR